LIFLTGKPFTTLFCMHGRRCNLSPMEKEVSLDSASSNDHEFFAVAIENFFERPLEFHDFHPQMYVSLARLLN